ncbi:MAG: hypothetical protein P1U34_01400 [Coxiellaceae bacterium]|nr:hypothetical protein [Coxiellaceae bacterium]
MSREKSDPALFKTITPTPLHSWLTDNKAPQFSDNSCVASCLSHLFIAHYITRHPTSDLHETVTANQLRLLTELSIYDEIAETKSEESRGIADPMKLLNLLSGLCEFSVITTTETPADVRTQLEMLPPEAINREDVYTFEPPEARSYYLLLINNHATLCYYEANTFFRYDSGAPQDSKLSVANMTTLAQLNGIAIRLDCNWDEVDAYIAKKFSETHSEYNLKLGNLSSIVTIEQLLQLYQLLREPFAEFAKTTLDKYTIDAFNHYLPTRTFGWLLGECSTPSTESASTKRLPTTVADYLVVQQYIKPVETHKALRLILEGGYTDNLYTQSLLTLVRNLDDRFEKEKSVILKPLVERLEQNSTDGGLKPFVINADNVYFHLEACKLYRLDLIEPTIRLIISEPYASKIFTDIYHGSVDVLEYVMKEAKVDTELLDTAMTIIRSHANITTDTPALTVSPS